MNAIRSIRKSAVLGGLACMGVLLAMPSQAHWGPQSALAIYGASKTCSHADAGNTNVRQARVTLTLHADWISFEGGGFYWYWDTVTLKNTSGGGKRVDLIGVYSSPYMDPSDWSGIQGFNDVNDGSSRTYGGWWSTTAGQVGVTKAACYVTNG